MRARGTARNGGGGWVCNRVAGVVRVRLMGWKLCGDKKERGLVPCRNRRRRWKGWKRRV